MKFGQVASVFKEHLDKVYAAGREGVAHLDGQNIFLYQNTSDGTGDLLVDFGVGTPWSFEPHGEVRCIEIPGGNIVTTAHFGSYAKLREGHEAIHRWCEQHHRSRTGVSWEIYGHWTDDPSQLRTDICYQLST